MSSAADGGCPEPGPTLATPRPRVLPEDPGICSAERPTPSCLCTPAPSSEPHSSGPSSRESSASEPARPSTGLVVCPLVPTCWAHRGLFEVCCGNESEKGESQGCLEAQLRLTLGSPDPGFTWWEAGVLLTSAGLWESHPLHTASSACTLKHRPGKAVRCQIVTHKLLTPWCHCAVSSCVVFLQRKEAVEELGARGRILAFWSPEAGSVGQPAQKLPGPDQCPKELAWDIPPCPAVMEALGFAGGTVALGDWSPLATGGRSETSTVQLEAGHTSFKSSSRG